MTRDITPALCRRLRPPRGAPCGCRACSRPRTPRGPPHDPRCRGCPTAAAVAASASEPRRDDPTHPLGAHVATWRACAREASARTRMQRGPCARVRTQAVRRASARKGARTRARTCTRCAARALADMPAMCRVHTRMARCCAQRARSRPSTLEPPRRIERASLARAGRVDRERGARNRRSPERGPFAMSLRHCAMDLALGGRTLGVPTAPTDASPDRWPRN